MGFVCLGLNIGHLASQEFLVSDLIEKLISHLDLVAATFSLIVHSTLLGLVEGTGFGGVVSSMEFRLLIYLYLIVYLPFGIIGTEIIFCFTRTRTPRACLPGGFPSFLVVPVCSLNKQGPTRVVGPRCQSEAGPTRLVGVVHNRKSCLIGPISLS